ncbi:MAG: hypothetical protein IJV27_10135 [Prevotella sp.]|nr:hypothetical protein [Prevotella sp.]
MKKKLLFLAMVCFIGKSTHAQSYSDDWSVSLPTPDLYDTGTMNAYIGAMAQTSAQRQQLFRQNLDWALEAYENQQWSLMIRYLNNALDTGYWFEEIYYYRGVAYEQLGDLSSAKKDYKTAKRKGSVYAADALERLNAKMKRNK